MPRGDLSLHAANDSLGFAGDLRGQWEVHRRAAHTDGELLTTLHRRHPLLNIGVIEAPIRLAEHENNVGNGTAGDAQLVEATKLAHHGLEAVKPHVKLGDCHSIALANVDDLECNSGNRAVAIDLQVLELKIGVGKPEAKWKGRRLVLSIIPAVSHQDILGEIRDHLLTPTVVLAQTRILPLREALLADLWQRDRKTSIRAGLARDELRQSIAHLLAWPKEHQSRINVVEPLGRNCPWHCCEDHDLQVLPTRQFPHLLCQVLGLWQGQVLPVPALLRMGCSTNNYQICSLCGSDVRAPLDGARILDLLLHALQWSHRPGGHHKPAATAGINAALGETLVV
mmetsp:Transcript_55205/g.139412  ORF Transcript_55205/g.139412 Transcript_55205/m.139412 type:complete len:340 (+) Transcript_55205:245-1264(+)